MYSSQITIKELLLMDVPLCYTAYLLISALLILISWITVWLSTDRKFAVLLRSVIKKTITWGVRVLFYGGIIWMARIFLLPYFANNSQDDLMAIVALLTVGFGFLQLLSELSSWKKRRAKADNDTDHKGMNAA